ncbi:transglutaminase-like domain-containing protein [Chryseobacterium antibioticum]|uniref:Transglutaminase-like domain-containing protein n=1 Tax=Chryseobacterium pyrolae TaxID=2987481 RepID=A0ABT2IFS1_9FLAO|nr:transglutaminase-like domain-containing protein [Chryseobacterium pyrolae]MCT2407500.1 transglutaminase-like domain-containing protein [Chryseobacterium pyrolae]
MSQFNSTIHLIGRHPEIARNEDFIQWNNVHGSQIWHETEPDSEGIFDIVIQSPDKNDIIAFHLKQIKSQNETGIKSEILEYKTFDLLNSKSNRLFSLIEANRIAKSKKNILAIRPKIDWTQNEISWEIDLLENQTVEKYISNNNQLIKINTLKLPQKTIPSTTAPAYNDWLEENELHHLNKYRALALQWGSPAITVSDKVFRVFLKTKEKMLYDGNILHIGEFTWADNLVIDQLGYRGICDEWAVIQITMLRALGIPSVLKFLTFNYNGKPAAHACVEWLDNGTWKHLDALWDAYDNKSVYRQNGATNVMVMDANSPKDNVYNGNAWGVPDVNGDGKLYPYGDFIINPAYPGNQRPGYSY